MGNQQSSILRMSKIQQNDLNEVFESESESEEEETEILGPDEEVAPLIAVELDCFLCGQLQECCCKLSEVVEGSEYTFADVLTKLFSREQLPDSLAGKDYAQGWLCKTCKFLAGDLFRLQKELKTVKNVIVRIFKNSENKEDSVVPPKQ